MEERKELEFQFLQNVTLNKDKQYFLNKIDETFFTKCKKEAKIILELYEKDRLEIVNIMDYDIELFEKIADVNKFVSALNTEILFERITELNNKRNIYFNLKKIIGDVETKTSAELINDISKIEQITVNVAKDVFAKDVLEEVVENITNKEKQKIIKTGIKNIDDIIYGFQENNYIVIAGRPGGGKTALALQIASNNLTIGKKVLFISLEMSNEDITQRILINQTGIPIKEIYNTQNHPRAEEITARLSIAINKISKMDFILEDNVCTSKDIIFKIKETIAKHKVDLVILDYIGLVQFETKSYSRENELATLSRTFKQITKEYKTPLIVLSQLNRGGADGEPNEKDIRETDALLSDANKVFLLWQDEDTKTDDISLLNCKIAKNREGKIGTVKLKFIKPNQRIDSF